jgi:hypothetical protein
MIDVVFVTIRKPSNIFSLIVILRDLYGEFLISFGLQSPTDVDNLSRMWFQYTGQHMHPLICMAASTILWPI